jgi:hypothetical protein
MTLINPAKPLFTRVETYLAGAFHPFPEERVIAGTIQSFSGWFFGLLRNAVICGALRYFADTTGSMLLYILATIGYLVLAVYCFSYMMYGVLTPFHFVKHKQLASWLDWLVTLAVLLLLGYAIWKGTTFAIDEIAKGHAASHGNAPPNSPGP